MPVPRFFKNEFDVFATDGAIGHPNGELAYGYLRVSSAGQADEGQSGLPRQIMHVHEAALKNGLKIPWDYLYADDDSGFDFADRPDLSRLRHEYKSPTRRAGAVVMEHLDRLSRNADWHQGYLLEEMKQYGLRAVFWKQFSSRIERAVMGAIAQDGMEQAKQRMADGTIHKARGGRVTAKTPAYGYKLVDSFGREGGAAKNDTHYAIRENEASVVRFVFSKVIEGYGLRQIGILLEGQYPPPKKFSHWESRMLKIMVQNPVYKGEFAAHRSQQIKITTGNHPMSLTETVGRTVSRKILRPPEEWIIVPVPAIVTPEEWTLANQILGQKYQMTPRNANQSYLLAGLLWCATCNYSCGGCTKKYLKKPRNSEERTEILRVYYRCASNRSRMPAIRKKIGCNQKSITAHILDQVVWSVVCQVLLHPHILFGALEREFKSDKNQQIQNQITFLETQIREANLEDEKLYRAYLSGAFDEVEYGEYRKTLKENKQKFSEEIIRLHDHLMTVEQFEERKREILMICQNAIENGLAMDAPFDVKKRIIHTIVDHITLNVIEGWFELDGVFQGKYLLPKKSENEPGYGADDDSDGYHGCNGIICNYKKLSARSIGVKRINRHGLQSPVLRPGIG
jgi:site-specific DNA recombinase